MGYRDTLRPPSFRGVPFEVSTSNISGGRRLVTHEYPQRDQSYSEDLGLSTPNITLVGFVIGANYIFKRDQLVAALSRGGPGTLVHPFKGSIEVVVATYRVEESSESGGVAKFTMSFLESGAVQFPSQDADTTASVSSVTASARTQIASDFSEEFSLTGQPDFVAGAAKVDIRRGFRELQRAAGG